MQRSSTAYIVRFAATVCVVCSLLVTTFAVLLLDRQKANAELDRQKKVLAVSELTKEGEDLSAQRVRELFDQYIETKIVDLTTGEEVPPDEIDPATFDAEKARMDPELSRKAPPNPSQIKRIPRYARVFHVYDDKERLELIVLPVEGYGLWGTLYGYLAVDSDGNTIRGITFYEHQETPGLGGEVDNPLWKAQWPGRKIYGDEGDVQIQVTKGTVGTPDETPYKVDALAGATITSNGVTNLLKFWLGRNGFQEYVNKQFREKEADTA